MTQTSGGRLFGCLWLPLPDQGQTLTREQLKLEYQTCLRQNGGRLILQGLFARANAVNSNNRVYPRRILRREVAKYVKSRLSSNTALGELDHPSYASPVFKCLNLANTSHQVLELEWRGNSLYGVIHVLGTPAGKLVEQLYRQGFHVGVSSRGWASVRWHLRKSHNSIMDDFELITFDFVTEPSTKGACLRPLQRPYQGSIPSQANVVTISECGIGGVPLEAVSGLPSPEEFARLAAALECQVKRAGVVAIPAKYQVASSRERKEGFPEWAVVGGGAGAEYSAAMWGDRIPAFATAPPQSFPAGKAPLRGTGTTAATSENADGAAALELAEEPGASGCDEPQPMQPMACERQLLRPAILRAPFQAFQASDSTWVWYGSYVSDVFRYGLPQAKGMRDLRRHMAGFAARTRDVNLGTVRAPAPRPMPGMPPAAAGGSAFSPSMHSAVPPGGCAPTNAPCHPSSMTRSELTTPPQLPAPSVRQQHEQPCTGAASAVPAPLPADKPPGRAKGGAAAPRLRECSAAGDGCGGEEGSARGASEPEFLSPLAQLVRHESPPPGAGRAAKLLMQLPQELGPGGKAAGGERGSEGSGSSSGLEERGLLAAAGVEAATYAPEEGDVDQPPQPVCD